MCFTPVLFLEVLNAKQGIACTIFHVFRMTRLGIEPRPTPYKASILPLGPQRGFNLVLTGNRSCLINRKARRATRNMAVFLIGFFVIKLHYSTSFVSPHHSPIPLFSFGWRRLTRAVIPNLEITRCDRWERE